MSYLILFFFTVFFISIFSIVLGFMSQLVFLVVSLSSLMFALYFGYKFFKRKTSPKHELNKQLLLLVVDRFSKLSISAIKLTKNITDEKALLETEMINSIKKLIEFDSLICENSNQIIKSVKDKNIRKLWKNSCSDLSAYFSNGVNYNARWKNEIFTEIEDRLVCLIEIKSVIFRNDGDVPHNFFQYI